MSEQIEHTQKIQLDERQLKNLIIFLNRVKYEGLEEAKAVIEIIAQIKNQTTPQKG